MSVLLLFPSVLTAMGAVHCQNSVGIHQVLCMTTPQGCVPSSSIIGHVCIACHDTTAHDHARACRLWDSIREWGSPMNLLLQSYNEHNEQECYRQKLVQM